MHAPLFRVLFTGGGPLLVVGAVEFWGVLRQGYVSRKLCGVLDVSDDISGGHTFWAVAGRRRIFISPAGTVSVQYP